MKKNNFSGGFRPFKDLKQMVRKKRIHLPKNDSAKPPKPVSPNPVKQTQSESTPERTIPSSEKKRPVLIKSFKELKEHVKGSLKADPSIKRKAWQDASFKTVPESYRSPSTIDPSDEDVLNDLNMLIETGKGFVLSDTAEYMEGLNTCSHPELLKKIHTGQFAIQDYIDLHGKSVGEAELCFHHFIKKSISTGKKSILVVHGRGLSSPNGPVLKEKIRFWLTKGPLRKYIVAFASARAVDGGTGATCVLLRHTPLTKRHRKKMASLYPNS